MTKVKQVASAKALQQPSPKQPSPKQVAPKQVAPKQEATKQEATKQEATKQEDTKQEAPKIEFPCDNYPVKVMGAAGTEFHQFAVEVMQRHAPGLDQTQITIKESRNGNFQSITFFITATGVEQLQSLHEDLRANTLTKIVL